MQSSLGPAEIETLRENIRKAENVAESLAILDRLSPPAPEVDEATRIWREMMAVSFASHTLADEYRRGLYDVGGTGPKQIPYLRTAISELIASKDARIQEWQDCYRHARKGWDDTIIEMSEHKRELAALRAENERLNGALAKIAAFERGGVIFTGTPESDRDYMIGIARQACQRRIDLAWNWRNLSKAAERNTAEPAKETTVSYDPNYNCPSCGVAIGMLHEPDCALMLSCTAEPAKTHVWPATHDDACSEIKGADTTPEVVVTDGDCQREQWARNIASYTEGQARNHVYRCAINLLTEAEARGRREALEEALRQFDAPTDAATYARAKILRMMTGGK